MFDFSGAEILVIGLVALIAIGPKDMPVAIRAITRVLKKMRRMAAEFQGHVDEMMREADLQDVSSTFRDLRSLNLKSALNTMVDGDGSLSRAMSDPFVGHPVPPAQPLHDTGAPSFIPPGARPPAPVQPPMADAPADDL